MKQNLIVSLFILSSCSQNPPAPPARPTPLDIISFHQGYEYEEQFKIFGHPYNLEQFIAGMQASKEGKPSPFTDEDIQAALTQLDATLADKQKAENLEQAQRFLTAIAKDPEVVELQPQKLYYKTLKKGHGPSISEINLVEGIYQTFKLEPSGKEHRLFSKETTPIQISLADTIPGFALGVQSMQPGERRKLYIHPDLAYGTYGGKLEPNQLLIIEFEVTNFPKAD
jgi:peptidylprolyl isomerase